MGKKPVCHICDIGGDREIIGQLFTAILISRYGVIQEVERALQPCVWGRFQKRGGGSATDPNPSAQTREHSRVKFRACRRQLLNELTANVYIVFSCGLFYVAGLY